MKRALTEELFGKMLTKAKADDKLEKIVLDLQKTVYPTDDEESKEENESKSNAQQCKESNDVLKAVMAKRKLMMINKMKSK